MLCVICNVSPPYSSTKLWNEFKARCFALSTTSTFLIQRKRFSSFRRLVIRFFVGRTFVSFFFITWCFWFFLTADFALLFWLERSAILDGLGIVWTSLSVAGSVHTKAPKVSAFFPWTSLKIKFVFDRIFSSN